MDCIYVCVFLLSKNYFEKLARHLLDSSSIPGGSIEKSPASSIASKYLVDQSSLSSCVFALFLDSFICRRCFSRHLPRQMSRHLSINWDSFACISFFFVLHFFSFVSIASCFSFSCRSMVPCSPRSLYVSFMFVSVMTFGFLCPLTIVSKRGRNLRIECHSSGGVIDLGGELHVKGKNVFDVTNLGGELVWYTLILIYFFLLCIFWFCNHLHTSCVVSILDDVVCVSLFISHVLFLFSLYTHVFCLFNLSLFFTWYLDVFCLVPLRKDKLKPSQDSEPSSCNNFQGSDLLD